MRLSVKIDTEEKKRRKSIRTKNLFAHHGSFSRLCLQYNLNKHTDGQTNKQTNERKGDSVEERLYKNTSLYSKF